MLIVKNLLRGFLACQACRITQGL